jgi:hypothetical protein
MVNSYLNGISIKEKAEEISLRFNIEFHVSGGWLNLFLIVIVYRTISEEA